jgi:hypothetical protein
LSARRVCARPEEDLQKTIVRFLGTALPPDSFMFAVPNQRGTRKKFEMGILKALGVRAGTPDLVILHRGRFFGLEVKAPQGGRLSDNQADAADAIVNAGGFYSVVRSVEEVERCLRGWGVILRATVLRDLAA